MQKRTASKAHPFAGKPHIMGVVNVTPDSFSDGGNFLNYNNAIEHGLCLVQQGASILDIGGESTRPGAEVVDYQEEIDRILPVIEGLRGAVPWISVDSRNAKTMKEALKAGANVINDISALTYDSESINIAKAAQVPVILMHMQGNPSSMQINPMYNNVVEDVFSFLKERVSFCEANRIDKNLLIIDPGIGFGKSIEDNLLILRNIKKFHDIDVPILLGVSRKSFIAKISQDEPPNERFPGSIAAALWGLSQGVNIFRVHDVAQTRQAFSVFNRISDFGF